VIIVAQLGREFADPFVGVINLPGALEPPIDRR
jgi:hypothetical protein